MASMCITDTQKAIYGSPLTFSSLRIQELVATQPVAQGAPERVRWKSIDARRIKDAHTKQLEQGGLPDLERKTNGRLNHAALRSQRRLATRR